MLTPPPRNPRDLFEAFRLYRAEEGLDSVLAAFDYSDASARQLHWAAFGCLPGAEATCEEAPAYDARQHLAGCLKAEDFQTHVLDRLLAAYPEKRRLLIVHVPKCAGSDLTLHLKSNFASVSRRIVEPGWTDAVRLATEIRTLVEELTFGSDIFVHGHAPLTQQMAAGQVRFGDAVFTVLRDPVEMVLSKVNYVITLFGRDPQLARADTRSWMRFLDRSRAEAAIASGDTLPLAKEILHSPKLIQGNAICTFLGRGDAASAIALCAQADVELTDVARYQDWLGVRWGIHRKTRKNASVKHLSVAELDQADLARVAEVTSQDRIFHERVLCSLDASGAPSVRGLHLAKRAG